MRKKTICLLTIIILALTIFPLIPKIKAQTATVSLSPSTFQVTQVNEDVYLKITISDVQSLWAWTCTVTWDPTTLTLVGSPTEGSFLLQGGSTQFLATPAARNETGAEAISDASYGTTGVSGSGVLASIEFQVAAQTSSTAVQLSGITLEGPPQINGGAVTNPTITPASTTSSTSISFVSGGAPAANAGPDQTVQQGATVTFDGSKSLSSGTNPTYAWSFIYDNANQTLSGINPTFNFNVPGIYVVTLIVTDSNGVSTPATVTITVNSNSKPVAVINVEGISQGQSVPTGQPITFNGTGSYEANNGTITKYLWEIGGGVIIGANATATYSFTITKGLKSENFNVTLTVFDVTNQNDTATTQITAVPGATPTSTPITATSTPTSTPSTNSTATTTPTLTPTPNATPQTGMPSYVLAITVIITIVAIGGSTVWLRKRT